MRQTFGLIGVMGLAAVLLTPSTSLAQQSVSFSFGGFVPKSEDARVDSRGRSDDVLVNNLDFLAFNIKDFNGGTVEPSTWSVSASGSRLDSASASTNVRCPVSTPIW